jgi:hypothetical protein
MLNKLHTEVYDFNIVFSLIEVEYADPVICSSFFVLYTSEHEFRRFTQRLNTNASEIPKLNARPLPLTPFTNNYCLLTVIIHYLLLTVSIHYLLLTVSIYYLLLTVTIYYLLTLFNIL